MTVLVNGRASTPGIREVGYVSFVKMPCRQVWVLAVVVSFLQATYLHTTSPFKVALQDIVKVHCLTEQGIQMPGQGPK